MLFPQDGPPKLLNLVNKSKKFKDLRREREGARGSKSKGVMICRCVECRERERDVLQVSKRMGVVICRCVECREKERCAVSARNMLARARGNERRGVVICKVLGVQRERERCAVSA